MKPTSVMLQTEAQSRARHKSHTLGPWQKEKVGASSHCVACGARVTINIEPQTKPAKRITGSAVTTICTGEVK